MSQDTRTLNFSDLTEEEKLQYIEFITANQIQFEEDDEDERYVARVRIKKSDAEENKRLKVERKENNRNLKKSNPSLQSYESFGQTSSYSTKQSKKSIHDPQKENSKSPFVLASNQVNKKPNNKIVADYMSFRNTQSESLSTFETHTEPKSLFQLMENIDFSRDKKETSLAEKSKEPQRMLLNPKQNENNRSKSVQPLDRKQNFEQTMETTFDKSPAKKISLIEENISQSIELYRNFLEIVNLNLSDIRVRPKKLSLDNLSRLIEEIFSTRFLKETNALKANISKGESTARENIQNQRNMSFPYFVNEFLKEKTKMIKNFEQEILSIAYSTFLYKRRSCEVEIFSRFLSEEIDNEDLTFFLFVRSLVEKELAIVLANKQLTTAGIFLTQKNCYRVLEAVYGKDEKILVNKVFKKIKEFIEWEKEKNINTGCNKIGLYTFLKITLEDYHLSRKCFVDSLDPHSTASDNISIEQTNQVHKEQNGFVKAKSNEQFETHNSRDTPLVDEIEPTHEDIKDEIERYLFDKSSEEPKKSDGALQDITSQSNIESFGSQKHLLSNLYNSFYNNPNSQLRNILSRQSISQMDSIQIDNSHIEEQNQNNEVSYKDSNQNHKILNYLPSQANNKPKYASLASNDCGENFESHSNVNTLTVLHHNSNKNLHFPHNLLLKNSVCSSNTQSTSSLHNENFNTGAMYQNRNSYSNLHRRNSGKVSQGSYSQLNNQRIQNSRNNSRAELCQHPEENQSPYNNRHYNAQNSNSEAVQNLSTKSNLKKMEKSNPTLYLQDKFVAPNQTMNDHSSSTGNFSFRNYDNQQYESELDRHEKDFYESKQMQLQDSQKDSLRSMSSTRHLERCETSNSSRSNELKEFCLQFILKKVHEFVETMLFEGQDERSPEEEKIMSGLMELFEKKFTALLDALFSFDKLRWLNSFMIEDPSSKQLQNIEELQKDLRSLQKKHFSDLCEDDIEVFANKIFRTPELSTQIGRLIVEFTLPQDMLYEEDIIE